MKHKMNRRAAVPVIAWIIIAVVGIILAQQLNLFAVFTPSIGQPSGADSLVNPVYYGDAIQDSNFACEFRSSIIFRSTFSLSSSNLPGSGNEIAVDEGGANLKGFQRTTASSSTRDNYCANKGTIIMTLSGGLKVVRESSQRWWICDDSGTGTRWDRYDSGGSISTSRGPQGGNEVLGSDIPIRGESKFTCREGNVVLQSCSSFGDFEIQQTCFPTQPCEFSSQFQTPDGSLPAVKCSGDFKPNQALCSDNTLFTTDSNAELDIEQCGFICSGSQCVDCQDGNSRCAQLEGTTTDVEICIGGQWTQQAVTCIGTQQCVESNNQAQCTSDFVNGQQRCSGKQPQIYSGLTQTWGDEGESCDVSCIMEGADATCLLECGTIGFSCDAGIMQHCTNPDRDNNLETIGSCVSGSCADESQCSPIRQAGDRYCSGGDIFISVPSGNSNDLNGGVEGLLDINCLNSCEPVGNNNARCTPALGCEGNSGLSICTDSFTRKVCSNDEQSYTTTENCAATNNGFCTVEGGVGVCQQPPSACEGPTHCTGEVIRECNDGVIGEELKSCNGLGCELNEFNIPVCTNECGVLDEFSCSVGDSYQCISDEVNAQLVLELSESCGNRPCVDGLCESQCTGDRECTPAGIRSCVGGIVGDVIDDCNNLGCDESSISCLDECSVQDQFSCSDGDSTQCVRQDNNQLVLEVKNECGDEGCSGGQCLTSCDPGQGFKCLGVNANTIWSCTSEGFLDSQINQCGVADESYCSENIGFCKLCELNSLSCEPNAWVKCINEQTGEKETLADCEVGCSVIGTQFNCDNLVLTVSGTQNFFGDEEVIILLNLEGDKTGNGVETSGTATIIGSGVDQTDSASSDINGIITFDFGIQSLGSYEVTVDLPEFNRQEVINVRVTNDFTISLFGAPTIQMIPGEIFSTEIEALDKGGNAPSDVIVTTEPPGVNVVSTESGVLGRWILTFSGEPGSYDVGLSATLADGTVLEEQFINTIQLIVPALSITTNIPESAKLGEQNYDINVRGPNTEGTTTGIIPDTITATISHGSSGSLALADLGGGSYTFNRDFTESGTYTINVEATKEGYDDVAFSKQLEISESGDATPPSSDDGDEGGDAGAGTGDGDGDVGTGTGEGGLDNNLVILLVVGAIVYFVFIRGKKK